LANSAQARKRARQAEQHRQHNMARRSMMRTSIKKVIKAIDSGDKEGATSAYQDMTSMVDRMAGKGIIHKNKAARHKSRLHSKIQAL